MNFERDQSINNYFSVFKWTVSKVCFSIDRTAAAETTDHFRICCIIFFEFVCDISQSPDQLHSYGTSGYVCKCVTETFSLVVTYSINFKVYSKVSLAHPSRMYPCLVRTMFLYTLSALKTSSDVLMNRFWICARLLRDDNRI